MKALPNNCRMGKMLVIPENWKTCGKKALLMEWYIKYRFYDDNLKRNKQIMISRFNTFDNIEDKREAMNQAIKKVMYELETIGYNPIAAKTLKPVISPENQEINKFTPFIPALRYAASKMKVVQTTMDGEILWVIGQLETAAKKLYFDRINIADITLKHLHLICEEASYKKDGSYSGDKFNRNKKVLRQLYKKLVLLEVTPMNFPMSLERQKGAAKKKKVLLTPADRKAIVEYLDAQSPRFLLFIQVFFHSGSRLTEMLRVKASDVDLKKQEVNYLVLKGRQYENKTRPIKDIAVKLWQEAIRGARQADYVFGQELMPSAIPIVPNVVKKRWQRLQEKLEIKASFYSLKHLNTTETTKIIGSRGAAEQNAESEEMIIKHYDQDATIRENDKVKKVNNPF